MTKQELLDAFAIAALPSVISYFKTRDENGCKENENNDSVFGAGACHGMCSEIGNFTFTSEDEQEHQYTYGGMIAGTAYDIAIEMLKIRELLFKLP